jgi:O-Antigen ligase
MGFALFLIYLLLTLVRPAERFDALRDWRFIEIASALALAGAAFSILTGHRPRPRAVQVTLVLLLVLWIVVTIFLSPMHSEKSWDKVLGFIKGSLTAFLLVILNVNTVRRVRAVASVLTIAAVFLAVQAVSDYRHGLEMTKQTARGDLETIDSKTEWDGAEGGPEQPPPPSPDEDWRLKTAGLFGDPNDLALTLIALVPIAFGLRRGGAYVRNTLFVWIPIALILYGVYVTRSRGGVLTLACVLGLLLRHRLGNTMSLVASGGAVMVLLAAGFVGSRSMSIDVSASGRIDMWSAGMQELKYSPVWGIGFGSFNDYNNKAAHSAYVECFAELGMVGYLIWLGLLVLTLDDMRVTNACPKEEAKDLRGWARALLVSLAGFMVGSIFLSRSYDVQLFIMIGIGTAIGDIARRGGYIVHTRGVLKWTYIIAGVAVASIIALWLYMRLLR